MRPTGLPQVSIVAVAMMIGFIVFVTVKGELGQYMAAVGLGKQAATTTPAKPGDITIGGQVFHVEAM